MNAVCYATWAGENPHLQLPDGWSSLTLVNYGEEPKALARPSRSRGAIPGKGGEIGDLIDWEPGEPILTKWASLLKRAWKPAGPRLAVCLGVDVGISGLCKPVGMVANVLRRSLPMGASIEYAGFGYDFYPRKAYRKPADFARWNAGKFREDRLQAFRDLGKCRPWAFIDVQDQWPDHGGDPSGDVVIRPDEQIRMQIQAVPFGVSVCIFASTREPCPALDAAILRACGLIDERAIL